MKKAGIILLIIGITSLLLGLIFGLTVGSPVVPTLIIGSVFLNGVGVFLLREAKARKRKELEENSDD
ncbi:MAG: hypothetical protein ACK5LX_07290 [Oscillospiraceae bacterium]